MPIPITLIKRVILARENYNYEPSTEHLTRLKTLEEELEILYMIATTEEKKIFRSLITINHE